MDADEKSNPDTAGGASTPSRAKSARDGDPGLCHMCMARLSAWEIGEFLIRADLRQSAVWFSFPVRCMGTPLGWRF